MTSLSFLEARCLGRSLVPRRLGGTSGVACKLGLAEGKKKKVCPGWFDFANVLWGNANTFNLKSLGKCNLRLAKNTL